MLYLYCNGAMELLFFAWITSEGDLGYEDYSLLGKHLQLWAVTIDVWLQPFFIFDVMKSSKVSTN